MIIFIQVSFIFHRKINREYKGKQVRNVLLFARTLTLIYLLCSRDSNCMSCIFPFDTPVWESCMGAAALLRAKRNFRSRLLFIWPSGKKDLVFIKNREEYISSSRDFITSGYSTEADHTQSVDLKHLLSLFV